MGMKMSIAYGGKETPAEEKKERKPRDKDKDRNITYHIRPIKNGFIKKSSWTDGNEYKEEEEYHETNPLS